MQEQPSPTCSDFDAAAERAVLRAERLRQRSQLLLSAVRTKAGVALPADRSTAADDHEAFYPIVLKGGR